MNNKGTTLSQTLKNITEENVTKNARLQAIQKTFDCTKADAGRLLSMFTRGGNIQTLAERILKTDKVTSLTVYKSGKACIRTAPAEVHKKAVERELETARRFAPKA